MTAARVMSGALLWVLGACSGEAVLQLFPPEPDGCSRGDCADAAPPNPGRGDGGSTDARASAAEDAGGAGCGSLSQRVQVSYPVLPAAAVPSDEYNPMLLAPRTDGESLLGYKEAGASRLRVLTLDGSGQVTGEAFQIEGEEAHALLAHEQGGALVYMREDPDIYSPEHCRGGDTPRLPICGSMELVRFDGAGNVTMAATLTDKVNVATDDASFIYWFEHTARLVWAEDTYGVYYRSARNHPAAGVDLVGTDSLRFIDADGNRRERGWTFGCFYSWSVRLAYNGFWVAACHADIDPNAHRVVVYDGQERRELTFLDGTAPVDRALGGLVAVGDGFWLSYLQRSDDDLTLHLARLDSTPSFEQDLVVGEARHLDSDYVFRTYLAAYGDDMLVGWKSDEQLVLAVADLESGALLEGPVVTEAPIDNLIEFVEYPGGDVGWAHSSSSGEVSVTRVFACDP